MQPLPPDPFTIPALSLLCGQTVSILCTISSCPLFQAVSDYSIFPCPLREAGTSPCHSDPHRVPSPSLSASSVLLTFPAVESTSSYASLLRRVLNTQPNPWEADISRYFWMLQVGVTVGLWGFPSVEDLTMSWILMPHLQSPVLCLLTGVGFSP